MRVKYCASGLYLDQAGHVYLPTQGKGIASVRLSAHASALWRQCLSGGVDPATLDERDQGILQRFLALGALRRSAPVVCND